MTGYEGVKRARSVVPLWRIIGGWLCLIGGIAALVLPVLPGVPLLFAGLVLLSTNYRWAQQCLHWLKGRLRKFADLKNKQRSRTVGQV